MTTGRINQVTTFQIILKDKQLLIGTQEHLSQKGVHHLTNIQTLVNSSAINSKQLMNKLKPSLFPNLTDFGSSHPVTYNK